MKQDPFERMRRSNPVPPGSEPPAPRGVADRIMGTGVAWPAWAIAAAAALFVIVVGGGTLLLVNRESATVVADTTSIAAGPTVTAEATLPATTPTTASPVASTAVTPAAGAEVIAYLLTDDPSATGPSPSLIPVVRSVPESFAPDDLPRAAMTFLLAGPTPEEADSIPALSTAIPEQTRLLGLTVADGVATVDLSAEFAAGSGSYSEIARIEQLIYTLTRFEEIDGIRLRIEGDPIEVFGSHGIVLADPAVRTEFDTTDPSILIEAPAYGGTVGNPLVATGSADVFEATVSLALTDANGLIIWEGFTTATCGTGCRGDWAIEIAYDVDAPQRGALIAWEESAADGSQTNVREHPVWLVPPGAGESSPTTLAPDEYVCSGLMVPSDLIDQPELPEAVAAMRTAIWDAAIVCDWDRLRELLAPGFSYSFGGGSDAIGHWQQLEIMGEEPLFFLAEILNRSGVPLEPDGLEYYVWPAAFASEWSEVGEAEREELRPLYDDEDLAGFDAFGGYIGYRIGILTDGTWVFFIEGD